MKEQYNLVVIGAGPGGFDAAVKVSKQGLSVAVIEEREIGGTCLNRGCIPTKTLLRAAEFCHTAKNYEALGVRSGIINIDSNKLYAHKDEVVLKLREGMRQQLERSKAEHFIGRGTILDAHTVCVQNGDETQIVKTENILIATGAKPARLPIEGSTLPGIVTSDELLSSGNSSCRRMVIVGGGVIGVEIASIFSAFGCEVTILEGKDRILPTMDREISQNLSMILKKRGISIHTGVNIKRFEKDDELHCVYEEKGVEQSIPSDSILVAVGRRANTEGLFGDGFSVESAHGAIVVNDKFQTSVPNIYAIGDAIYDGIQLAHAASAQADCFVESLYNKNTEFDKNAIPLCVYTDPEIASVGITEADAKAAGLPIRIGKAITSTNGKSVLSLQERGFAKLIFSADEAVLLGAQLMCAHATDIISELASAVVNKLTLTQLSNVIRPHPTFSEVVTDAIENAKEKV